MVMLASLVLLCIENCAGSECTSGITLSVAGTLTCNGVPVPRTQIIMRREIGFVSHLVASGYTDAAGKYFISGSPIKTGLANVNEPWPVTIEALRAYKNANNDDYQLWFYPTIVQYVNMTEGETAHVDIEDKWGRCARYLEVVKGVGDFEARVGYCPPFIIVGAETSRTKSPSTQYNHITIPEGFDLTSVLMKHELAHAIRNSYDGDISHFASDEKAFSHYGPHSCKSKTSPEFAFNEGWAEYWAGECMQSDENGDMSIEGNVAQALRSVQTRCDTSDHDMWEVLRQNPGKIHKIEEYMAAHKELVKCE